MFAKHNIPMTKLIHHSALCESSLEKRVKFKQFSGQIMFISTKSIHPFIHSLSWQTSLPLITVSVREMMWPTTKFTTDLVNEAAQTHSQSNRPTFCLQNVSSTYRVGTSPSREHACNILFIPFKKNKKGGKFPSDVV